MLGVDLPSYPETTALALIGLVGQSDLADPLALAKIHLGTTRSPLAKAWLRIALMSHSEPLGPAATKPLSANDVIVNALEVIAATGAIV